MTDKKLVGISLIKHYDDGSTEAWQKVSAPAVGAILAAGLATSPVGNRGAGGKYANQGIGVDPDHDVRDMTALIPILRDTYHLPV